MQSLHDQQRPIPLLGLHRLSEYRSYTSRSAGLPRQPHQTKPPTAVPNNVLKNANPAAPVASSAEPALKPNQPIHSRPVPIAVIIRLCGGIATLPKPLRGPSISAATSAAIPALICTTVPPAK